MPFPCFFYGEVTTSIHFHVFLFSVLVLNVNNDAYYMFFHATGEYVMALVLNKPPVGGTCSGTMSTGRALIDKFELTCIGWTDPEDSGMSQYVFFCKYHELPDNLNVNKTMCMLFMYLFN